MVKSRLKASLGRARLTFRELETTLIEVEAIVNSRPLAAVRADPEEPIPISPGHFLLGRTPVMVPDGTKDDMPTEDVGRRLRANRYLLRTLWKAFQRDYLVELQVRKKWHDEHDLTQIVGRIVIIKDETSPKGRWQRGIITKATAGRDGLVRSCEVRLPNRKTVRRAVQHLALIPDVTEDEQYSLLREHPTGATGAGAVQDESSNWGVISEDKRRGIKGSHPVSQRSQRRAQLRHQRHQRLRR